LGERPSGPIEESKDLLGSVRPRHTSDQIAIGSPIPLPIPSQDVPELFKAVSNVNVSVAEAKALDGPGVVAIVRHGDPPYLELLSSPPERLRTI
jgi:hypothetical protein